MYDKPARYGVGSTQQLVDMAIKYGGANAAGWLAKVMQNPMSGVDPTHALLAGMQLKQIAQPEAVPPTTTVKDDTLAGLEEASIPEDMFDTGVGEVMPTKNMAAGGLVAFRKGGEVGDSEEELIKVINDPRAGWERQQAAVQKLRALREQQELKLTKDYGSAKLEGLRQPGEFVLGKNLGAPAWTWDDVAGKAVKSGLGAFENAGKSVDAAASNMQAVQEDPNRTAFQADLAGVAGAGLGAIQNTGRTIKGVADITARGLGAVGEYFTGPQGKKEQSPAVDNRAAMLAGEYTRGRAGDMPIPGETPVSELPPMSARGGGGGGASGSASYTSGGKPFDENTDLDKEIKTVQEAKERNFPKSAMEIEAEKWLGDEAVAGRAKEQKRQDLWESLMYLGFGAAANDSPYWTQAWGQAGKELAPHVSRMMKARKDEKDAIQKAKQAMAQAKRARDDDTFNLASKNVSDAEERIARARLQQEQLKASWAETQARIASANRPGRDEKFVDYLAAQYMSKGMGQVEAYDKASREVMDSASGLRKYNETQGRMTKKQATDAWSKEFAYGVEYRRIKKAEGQAAADAYKEGVINSLMSGGDGGTDTTASDGASPGWGGREL